MGEVSGGPGPPWRQKSCRTGGGISRWTLLLFFQIFLLFGIGGVLAEKNKLYAMQSLCKNHFLQQLYRKIDGAVLWSQNERNLDCIITFQTHSILQRFMLRFDLLQLDCNDHLYIYDGAHAVGTYKADLSCRSTKKSVGSLFTRTNFVTLKYVTDGWGTDSNGFRLVITAVKDPKHACKDFRCNLREFCIATDLVCDNIDHCSDGSDESSSALCQNTETSTVLGLELTWFVVAVVSAVLVLCACGVATAVCVCRRGASARLQHPAAQQPNACSLQQMYGSNGAMKHTAGGGNGSSGGGTSAVTTLPPGGTYPTSTLVKVPGNWPHPAGLLGYRSISNTQARVRLYCQLEK